MYDSGDEEKIAQAILRTKYSHTIAFYRESCKEAQYIPVSEASLWMILHELKLLAETIPQLLEMNGFATLQKIAKKIQWENQLMQNLSVVKDT